MASISQLEKSIKSLAAKLEKRGFKTEIDIFKSGQWADSPPSYVELDIEIEYENRWREDDSYSKSFTFEANGYAGMGIREMKNKFTEELESDLKKYYINV